MEELERYIGEIKKILGFDISKEKMLETNNAILFNEAIKKNIYFLKYGIEKIYNIVKKNNIDNDIRISKLKSNIKMHSIVSEKIDELLGIYRSTT